MERIVVEKATGKIIDYGAVDPISGEGPKYDPRFYDNLDVADGTTADWERRKEYFFDRSKPQEPPAEKPWNGGEVKLISVWLNEGVEYSQAHEHPVAQIVSVLHGSLNIADAGGKTIQTLTAGESAVIPPKSTHKLVGAEDNSLIVTAFAF